MVLRMGIGIHGQQYNPDAFVIEGIDDMGKVRRNAIRSMPFAPVVHAETHEAYGWVVSADIGKPADGVGRGFADDAGVDEAKIVVLEAVAQPVFQKRCISRVIESPKQTMVQGFSMAYSMCRLPRCWGRS